LSHDDIGGLRFLYSKNNYAVEQLVAGTTLSSRATGSPWTPFVGTNVVSGTNVTFTNIVSTLITNGLRAGLDKLRFKKVKFDSLLSSNFRPFTNTYTDTVLSNSHPVRQLIQRAVVRPDLLFTSEDLGLVDGYFPFIRGRTGTGAWQNNDAINGNDAAAGDDLGGPGVIGPPIQIMFSNQLPFWINELPNFGTGPDAALSSSVWGSFDENTEVPVIYPLYLNLTLQDLRRLSGGNR
jgi:hypothetical protein